MVASNLHNNYESPPISIIQDFQGSASKMCRQQNCLTEAISANAMKDGNSSTNSTSTSTTEKMSSLGTYM